MPIVLSDAHFPILIATAVGDLTDREVADYLAGLSPMGLDRGKPYTLVFDAVKARTMSGTQRQMNSSWIVEHKAALQKVFCGVGYVVATAYQRGILSAVHWISPPPYPYAVCAQRADAMKWCAEQLRIRRVQLPADAANLQSW